MPSLRLPGALPLAVGAGWALSHLHAPLPWMIGPMLTFAIANAFQANLRVPFAMRAGGQWLIGSAIGLYFTAPVLLQVGGLAGWIALAVVTSLLITLLASNVLVRLGHADPATAFFASTIGGAAEMANLAEPHGARVDRVAAAQAIRVLLVVLIVPLAFKFGDWTGTDAATVSRLPFNPPGLLVLLALGGLLGGLFARWRIPNAWLFGPLLVSTCLTATDHALSAVPTWAMNLGQLLIGCSLGARFAPDFFRDSPRFVWAVLVSVVLMLAGCAAVGGVIALLSELPAATAVLASAPGGLAEMVLTAEALQWGVPAVTAFHTIRLIVMVLVAAPAFRWLSRRNPALAKPNPFVPPTPE